jgi:hypothetical protein
LEVKESEAAMNSSLAILSSDANLLRCQVAMLRDYLRPLEDGKPRAVGLGYVEADNILLRKKPGNIGTLDLDALVSDVISEVLFFHAGPINGTAFTDEDVMPLRYRRWMFQHAGALASPGATRVALAGEIPSFLARQAKGSTASELVFLTFLSALRDSGHADDFDIRPDVVGRYLGVTARRVERIERASGRVGNLSFFVTNGRVLAATRLNSGPLHYSLLEGISRCNRCGITESTPESSPLVRAHRRVRGVAVASDLVKGGRFLEVPEASTIAVGHNLDVHIAPIAPVP